MVRRTQKKRSGRIQRETDGELGPAALAVHVAPEQARLELLEKEHERLLRDISKRKEALGSLKAIADGVLRDLLGELVPVKVELQETLRQTRRLFEALIAEDGQLRRRDKKAVGTMYADLLSSLPWELLLATEPESGGDENDATEPFEGEPFGRSPGSDGSRSHFGRRPDGSTLGEDEEAGYSASRPDEKRADGLRSLFKRLVARLHPDKVRDDTVKAERTAALKEITRAYETGDLAKLIEIERGLALEVLAASSSDDTAARARQLVQSNDQLRAQLRALTAERKALRDELPFQLDLRSPSNLQSQAQTQSQAVIREAREELESYRGLRDFVQRFVDGEMSVQDFLLGPGLSRDELNELMTEVLLERVAAPVADKRAPRRASRRS